MAEAQKSSDIGMRRGRVIANLSLERQLDFIAEGLPILMRSAGNLLAAARSLDGHPRSASLLLGHSLEETAKILILMDIVRCPKHLRSARIGDMMKWFYDHLARLLYIEAQSWRPVHPNQLQDYLDEKRKSHYLEGYMDEYILPNWSLAQRVSQLYADIVTYEDGIPIWNEPSDGKPSFGFAGRDPAPWEVCCNLNDFGAFTREGLDIVSSAWGNVNFEGDDVPAIVTNRLTYEMAISLQEAGLLSERATEEKLMTLYRCWQLPMYHMNFTRMEVRLEDLKAQQEGTYWAEAGY